MANDAYLQIDSIKGESTDQKHKDWIEVSNVLYAIHQPRAETTSTAGGLTSGRADLLPITFKKLADIASRSCCKHAQQVRLSARRLLNS